MYVSKQMLRWQILSIPKNLDFSSELLFVPLHKNLTTKSFSPSNLSEKSFTKKQSEITILLSIHDDGIRFLTW